MGVSPIGISGFGSILVYGYNRVPFPPAIITTGTPFSTFLSGLCCRSIKSACNTISTIFSLSFKIGKAVIPYCCIISCAFALSACSKYLGDSFIAIFTVACKSPVLMSHLLISPSVIHPTRHPASSSMNKIPFALLSIFSIASTIVIF